MVALILVNGPPASGKSTLAARLVAARPLALNLDIDLVRNQLGGWLDQPTEAGLAARALAITMANTHLDAGLDLVVPQFLARTGFIEQLEQVARCADATFMEVVLELSRSDAIDAFGLRTRNPTHRVHVDAAELVDRSESPDPVGDMYDALEQMLETRPGVHRVRVVLGDVEATFGAFVQALRDGGLAW